MPTGALVAVVLLGALVAGCGGQSDRSATLEHDEAAAIRQSQSDIHSYCRSVRSYLIRKRGPLTSAEVQRVEAAGGKLADAVRAKPDADYQGLGPVREVIGSIAEDLEATNCAPSIQRRLDAALGSLPPPR